MKCAKILTAIAVAALALLLTGCPNRVQNGIEVRTVEVIKEVQVPCPVALPPRPATILPSGLPEQAQDAVSALYAALLQWQGDGKYADQAEAALRICTEAAE